MLLVEPDSGAIINANLAATRFYGYSREELLGLNIGDINQLSPDEIVLARRRVIAGESVHFVFRHKRADNQIRTVEVYSPPSRLRPKLCFFRSFMTLPTA